MKKKFTMALGIALVITMVLSGCSKGSSGAPKTNYDPAEYIELGAYTDLPYYTEEVEVTDEELQEQIDLVLLYATETETVTEGVVEDGDTINVAFVGKIDGEEFEGGSSESYDITIGTTSMIDGFVEGLIGKNIGETVTLNLKFPDDYSNQDVAGKDVVFDVTINSKNVSKTPELTDDFVKEYYDAENVEAFKEQLKADLIADKETSRDNSIKSSLWNVILETSNLKSSPEEEVTLAKEQVAKLEEDYKSQATMYGMEWADFLQTMMGTDEAGFQTMMDDYVNDIVKNNVVVKAISKAENISFTESEFKERIKEILDQNGLTEDTFKSYYNMTIEEYAEENGWRDNFLLEKIMDKVLELGKEVPKDEFEAFVESMLPAEEEAQAETPAEPNAEG